MKIHKRAVLTDGSDLKNLRKLVVPGDVTLIGNIESDKLEEVDIGMADILNSSFEGPSFSLQLPNLAKYVADKRNPRFSLKSGVLYSKDVYGKKQIYAYPAAKKNRVFTLDKSVRIVGNDAFIHSKYLKKITIPEGVKSVYSGKYGTFKNCIKLREIVFDCKIIFNHQMGTYGVSSCPKLTRIVLNNKQSGFSLAKDKKSRVDEIKEYKAEYGNVCFYVKRNSRALRDVKEIGLKYKFI